MVIKTGFIDVVIPQVSFAEYNYSVLRKYDNLNKTAIVESVTGKGLTHNEIRLHSIKLASAFTKRGLKRQEVLALCTQNCVEYPVIILATSSCNAITTTCNPSYKFNELKKQFQLSEPKFVVTDSEKVPLMQRLAKEISSIKEIFVVEGEDEYKGNCESINKLIKNDDGKDYPFQTEVDIHEDVVLLPFSSGTTGVPKGVMLTHYNLVSNLNIGRGMGKTPPWMVAYTVLPMFHAFGIQRLFSYLQGVTHVIDKRFKVETFFKAVEQYRVNGFGSVPPILMAIANSPLIDKYDLSSLGAITHGAAPMQVETASKVMTKTNSIIIHGWGLTESIYITAMTVPGAPLTCAGFVVPNTKLKVVNPITGRELGVGEDGELLVKGPQVMKGYYKNPEASSKAFDQEGWLRTGDIGHYDENKVVSVVDRLKELIKYKGFQVAPAELENLICEHPDVYDVAVVGIPHKDSGEVPKAFVVRKKSTLVTSSDIEKHVEENASTFKHLRGGVEFVEFIPKSDTGKILRRVLRERNNKSKL